jgi:hypothetical protein
MNLAEYVIHTRKLYYSTSVNNCVMKKTSYILVCHYYNFILICVNICINMFYVILKIKLFVNILLFIVQHNLNNLQINSTKFSPFLKSTVFLGDIAPKTAGKWRFLCRKKRKPMISNLSNTIYR